MSKDMEDIKKLFWLLFSVFMLVLVVGGIFYGIPAISKWGNGFYPSRVITVTAEGKTTATPDLAEVSFSVVTQGQNPQSLSQTNIDKMNAVLQFVKSQGIDEKDIKTTSYNLVPNYQWDKGTQRNYITGYTLTQTVLAKVRDLTKVASLLGGLAPLGVNQIGGVNFTFADDEKVLAAARADAFAKARAKAEEMANEAGVSLGAVVGVSESNYVPRPYLDSKMYATGMGGASMAVAPAPEIQPGTQDITDNVTMVFELK